MAADRPYAFALATFAGATVLTSAVVLWANVSPERVVIGVDGRHDAPPDRERLADCLDCHVPFVGTPASRCLSPGCHGALATGSPPREGNAMPVRFHAALRGVACGHCHLEDGDAPAERRVFHHDVIPEGKRHLCSRCHSGAKLEHHNATDAVLCRACHETTAWTGKAVDHRNVWQHACDVCHAAPASPAHASVAGTCSACHRTDEWTPQPAEAEVEAP